MFGSMPGVPWPYLRKYASTKHAQNTYVNVKVSNFPFSKKAKFRDCKFHCFLRFYATFFEECKVWNCRIQQYRLYLNHNDRLSMKFLLNSKSNYTSLKFLKTNFILKTIIFLHIFFLLFWVPWTLFSAIFRVFRFLPNFRDFSVFPYRGKLATLVNVLGLRASCSTYCMCCILFLNAK